MDPVQKMVSLNNEKLRIDKYIDAAIHASFAGLAPGEKPSKVHVQMLDKVLRPFLYLVAEARLDDTNPDAVMDACVVGCSGMMAELIAAVIPKGDGDQFIARSNEMTRDLVVAMQQHYQSHYGKTAPILERAPPKKSH